MPRKKPPCDKPMGEYREYRTKHALAVDRGINAQQQYGEFNPRYAQKPNRSDVEDYDDRCRVVPKKHRPKKRKTKLPKPPKKPTTVKRDTPNTRREEKRYGEYLPTEEERLELLKHFHKQPQSEQYIDLTETKNVIRRHDNPEEQIKKWKRNPKTRDIRTVDTVPMELKEARIGAIRKKVNVPVKITGMLREGTRGTFRAMKGTLMGRRVMVKEGMKRRTEKRVLAHELGHAFEHQHTKEKITGKWFTRSKLGKEWQDVERLTRKEIDPYVRLGKTSFSRYRDLPEEMFANWFSGLVVKRHRVKEATPKTYRKFQKRFPDFLKTMKRAEKKTLKQFIR